MKKMNPFALRRQSIPVVMAFDPGFLLPSAVTMISVLENGNKEIQFHFYIMTDQKFCDMDLGLFERIAGRYQNFSYEYVSFEDCLFTETRLPMHVTSKFTFARMLIPTVLPELDFCIYLDGDMLVRQDLSLLKGLAEKSTAFEQCYLMAAPDLSLQNGQGEFFDSFRVRLGLGSLENYFNAGTMVMNLRKLREDKMLDHFKCHADRGYYFGDQDILNVCCRGKVLMLPVRWDMYPGNIGDERMLNRGCTQEDKDDIMNGNAAILHFAGKDKPWNCIETFWEHEWYQYACMLPKMPTTEKYLDELGKKYNYRSTDDRTDSVRNARRYILYGYTEASQNLLDLLRTRNIGTPWCFCDASPEKRGKIHNGVTCFMWEDICSEIDEDTLIILCARNAWKEIREELVSRGISEKQLIRYRARDLALLSCEKE